MKKHEHEGYGTKSQGSCDPGKTWLKVPDCRTVAINKDEINAVLAKYRGLGIRVTEGFILSQVYKHFQNLAVEKQADSFTDKQVLFFWERYKKTVLRLTPEAVIDLAGFDPRILLKPRRRSRR